MARRRISLPRRWRTVLAALLSLAALLGPATGTAQAPKPAQTWAAEWEVLAPGAPLAGSLRDVVREAQGQELLLAAGAESGHFESAVHDMGREFGAVAALWTALPSDAAALTLEVQVSRDGLSWSPWQALVRDDLGAERAPEALSHSELVFERGRYVRLRVTLNKRPAAAGPRLRTLRLVAIDASEGPTPLDSKIALAVSDSAPPAPPSVISRAAWGANEAYMTWPPEYAPVTHFV
ncbi:MAG: hypothetical protein QME94_07725, partial [Anaerolineae bacterium]|nr:hypothetical protein [Anaerolineae bacterium]